MSALAQYTVERSLSNVSELSGGRWSRWRRRQRADDFRCTIVRRHARRPRAEHRLTRKGSHPASARTAVQSPRASSQPRPKLIPALKPNPLSPQRWPLRHRHPTVTAGQAGNDVSLRPLWRYPLSIPRWVGRARTRMMWIRSHRHSSAEGAVRARSSRPLRCPQRSRTIMARGA